MWRISEESSRRLRKFQCHVLYVFAEICRVQALLYYPTQRKCSLRGNLINYSDNASFPVVTIGSLFLFGNPVTGKMVKCAGVTKTKENDGFEDGCPDKNCYLFGWPTCCAYIGFRVITASTFIYYLHKYMNDWWETREIEGGKEKTICR